MTPVAGDDNGIVLRRVATNGLQLRIAECGDGPLVVLVHGFPGLWYSWRHQMPALAAAGFRVVAVDQRGYGGSDRPTDVAAYDSEHVIADMTGLLAALGRERAVFVGHDFGSAAAWNLAVRRPQSVAAVASLSVPYDFDLAGRSGMGSGADAGAGAAAAGGGTGGAQEFAVPGRKPTELFADIAKQHFLHLHYFQQVGPAERELGPNVRLFLTRLFWALSAHGDLLRWTRFPSVGTGYLDVLADPPTPLPWPWMSVADMDYYVAEFSCKGPDKAFIGGLNSYRVADRNWEQGKPWADADVQCPAWFIAGAEDPVLKMITPDWPDILARRVPGLRGAEIIAGAGHFVQLEQPQQVTDSLLRFLGTVRMERGDW